MNHAALDGILKSIDMLADTLSGRDCAAIERAIDKVSDAVDQLRGVSAWDDDDELRVMIGNALNAAELARARINLMRDSGDQKLERLGALRPGRIAALAYDRTGQQRRAPFKSLR